MCDLTDLTNSSVLSLSCQETKLYVSCLTEANSSLILCLTLNNETPIVTQCITIIVMKGSPIIRGLAAFDKGVAFCIEHQIMIWSTSSQNVSILAGDGVRGARTGSALQARFIVKTIIPFSGR